MTTEDMIRALGNVIEEYKNKPVFTGQTDIPTMCRDVIGKLKELSSPWHTGTPTEEGWYLLKLKKDDKPYCVAYMDGRHWLGINDFFILVDNVVKWQKIEEKQDGRTD